MGSACLRSCWRGASRGQTTGWQESWPRGSSRLPLSLECLIYSPVSIAGIVPRTQPWGRNVLLRQSGCSMWLNPVKATQSPFKILGGTPKTSLVLLLIKLARLERPASFFTLSLPSLHGGQFMNQDRSTKCSVINYIAKKLVIVFQVTIQFQLHTCLAWCNSVIGDADYRPSDGKVVWYLV